MKVFYSLLFSALIFPCIAQPISEGDSLFSSAQYTQAIEIYESIYQEGKASPAMLLRMAFIEEGLDNYATALYYLNQYYQLTANREVLDKMREIAEDQGLRGYEYSDSEFFRNIILRYKMLILSSLSGIALGLLIYILYLRQKKSLSIQPLILQFVIVLLIVLVTNNFFTASKAIISQNQTILMSGPSGGSEPIEVLERGHKVSIMEVDEVWVKITWSDIEGYVRKNRLMSI